ncbi:MAG: type II toxin-antitoxin system PemK/MazF family toxin [Lachnospiraceae bacterium]|nr:type II toxin-antitoxin system PemK/MazF family toxin [Lachnospiraceae bacterium]
MQKIEQGDLLKVGGLKYPVIVVSNDFFNESGKAIVCPIVKDAIEGPLHIKLKDCAVEGYVLCEQVRYVDLAERRFSKMTATHYFDIMDISDAVMGMFDYQAL